MSEINKKIVYVDGFAIRNTLDDDFGICHAGMQSIAEPAAKFYIPATEIWVDYRYRDETNFLIAVDTFVEPTAAETYDARRARAKEKFCDLGGVTDYILRTESKGELVIRYVDGAKVRRGFDPEFILGGHDFVYDYIPAPEIWLDDKMDPAELSFILLHEEVERRLMSEGKPYHIAHEYATARDKELRRARGVGSYPGDPAYPSRALSNQEIIKKYYARAN